MPNMQRYSPLFLTCYAFSFSFFFGFSSLFGIRISFFVCVSPVKEEALPTNPFVLITLLFQIASLCCTVESNLITSNTIECNAFTSPATNVQSQGEEIKMSPVLSLLFVYTIEVWISYNLL